jgi:ubiquinone biosynthesis protein COQ4
MTAVSAAYPLPSPVVPSLFARARKVCGASWELAKNPGRLDQVLVLAEAMNVGAIPKRWARFASNPDGRRLLAERPRIDREHVDLDALERLPDGTLGREYARFMRDNGITQDPFHDPPNVGDDLAAYVMLRFRQTHDLWHVLTGYAPDVEGELLLQAFSYAQTGAPSALFLAGLGTVRYMRRRRGHLARMREAYRRGKATRFLGAFRWEDHWETPVAKLRDLLACPPARLG